MNSTVGALRSCNFGSPDSGYKSDALPTLYSAGGVLKCFYFWTFGFERRTCLFHFTFLLHYVWHVPANRRMVILAVLNKLMSIQCIFYCRSRMSILYLFLNPCYQMLTECSVFETLSCRSPGRVGLPGFTAYSATKYGVVGFSDCLRREMAKFKVKVVTVEPNMYRSVLR